MKFQIAHFILAFSLLTSSAQAQGVREIIGRIGGGLIGGALCDAMEIGKGNGRVAAIALCAVGGSLIGGEIGREMDAADARAFERAQRRSFDGDLNQDYYWDGSEYGSRTGINGSLRPVRHGYNRRTSETCREYVSITHRGNLRVENRSIVCRKSDGHFYSLEERSLFVNGQLVEREREETTRDDGYVTPGRRPVPPPVRENPPRYGDERRGSCRGWNIDQVVRGDVIYTRFGQIGTLQGRNHSRREIAIQIDRRYTQIVSLDNVAIEGCQLGLQTGISVATRYGQQGILAGVFQNGDVIIQMGRYMQVLNRDDIYY
jgi:surface antigen